ncbi:hypothetical protein ACFVMC_30965 [Nocardia sp. NPDC127579]
MTHPQDIPEAQPPSRGNRVALTVLAVLIVAALVTAAMSVG